MNLSVPVTTFRHPFFLSLFACPKSNQKRQPGMKQPIPGVVLRFSFYTTVVKDNCSVICNHLKLKVYKDTAWKTKAEATVAIPLNQGSGKGTGCFVPFLIFLWLLSLHQGKESDICYFKHSSGKPPSYCSSRLALAAEYQNSYILDLCSFFNAQQCTNLSTDINWHYLTV